MNRLYILRYTLLLGIIAINASLVSAQTFIPEGRWRGVFHQPNGTDVPFNFEVRGKSAPEAKIYLLNAEERFETSQPVQKADSLIIPFDQFDTELAFKIGDKQLTGFFRKKDRTGKAIPVDASFGQAFRFDDKGKK